MSRNKWITVLGIFALFLLAGDVMGSEPGSSLAPIKGIAYQPVPSDYPNMGTSCNGIYFDTDFFNSDFTCIWQSGCTGCRGDLETMAKTLGANFLHLYDWNPQRDHGSFLNECENVGLHVAVPFSNFFAGNPTSQAQGIVDIITEVYGSETTPHPAVVMWTIANEYDLAGNNVSAGQIAQVAQIILYTEQNIVKATSMLPISSPVSFGAGGDSNGTPAVKAIHDLFVAISNTQEFNVTINSEQVTIPALPSDFWDTRYVAGTNPQNCGSPPDCAAGLNIQEYLSTTGGKNSFNSYFCNNPNMGCDDCITKDTGNCFPKTNLWFSEIGTGVLTSCSGWNPPCTPSEQQQASFDLNQLQASNSGTPSFFLGSSVFEFLNETWKGNPDTTNDATFGINKYSSSQIGTCNTSSQAPMCPNSNYPVDNLDQKPSFDTVQMVFKDSDGDGVLNPNDNDSDNDGIPNSKENTNTTTSGTNAVTRQNGDPNDPDADGIPNELDLDSDGDCICDILEAGGTDEDRDCVVDNFEDLDGNGLNDDHDPDQGGVALTLPDTDNDGTSDFLDPDSDNDGVADTNETIGGKDVDGDGIHDDLEDLNGDGVADSCQLPTGVPVEFLDSDGDGIFDHLDSVDNTGGCSVASVGTTSSIPLYLLVPVFIVIRRVWILYN